MKTETKKLVITIINIVIFIGNAIISQLSDNAGSMIATASSAIVSTIVWV